MTHTYSTDSTERKTIPFFIAAAAILVTFLTSELFAYFGFVPPWWLSLPIDTMAFYAIFYLIFDRVVWKWQWVHSLKITRIPNLSGEWHGHVNPVREGASDDFLMNVEIRLVIKQTWTEFLITGYTNQSRSRSISASFVTSDEQTLSYEYINEPVAGATNTMHAHRGVAHLIPNNNYTVLDGEYYSGRDRQGLGTINVKKISD
jgi:hypothetical protein